MRHLNSDPNTCQDSNRFEFLLWPFHFSLEVFHSNLVGFRAAKFTKNKNDQWNRAGGFSIPICAGLSLKMQPRNN